MCGIVGIVSSNRGVDPGGVARAMMSEILHRGPDDNGVEVLDGETVALAHVRLSIIDLSAAGHQPMWDSEKNIVLSYNGEIYNYREIRKELEELGHRFVSDTDTEVLINGYREWGRNVLERLNGMFAFGLFDKRSGSLWLVRDRLGVKPLYYAVGPGAGEIAFASELKAMLRVPWVDTALSGPGLGSYFSIGYIAGPETILKSVRRLPAAHSLTLERGGEIRISRYWSPGGFGKRRARAGDVEALRDGLSDATKRRMVADVPVGAFLSGGLDSTIVVGLMQQLAAAPVKTFSAAYDVGPRSVKYNEDADFADRVAAQFGADHTRLVIGRDENLVPAIRKFARVMDEPHANPSFFSTMLLAEKVRERDVPVVLTGDGSDEIFGGYPRYKKDRLVSIAERLPGPVRDCLLSLTGVVPGETGENIRKLLEKSRIPPFTGERLMTWWEVFSEDDVRGLLPGQDDAARVASVNPAFSDAVRAFAASSPSRDNRDAMRFADMTVWIPEESNMRVDKATMSAAVESRSPFLDFEFVEFAGQIACADNSDFRQEKKLLRKAFSDLVPDFIMNREKRGWLSPSYHWLRQDLREDAIETIRCLEKTGLFGPGIRNYADQFDSADNVEVWALYMFGLWYREFLS